MHIVYQLSPSRTVYLTVKNSDPSYYWYQDVQHCNLLLCYTYDKRTFHREVKQYYALVQQMLYHNAVDWYFFETVSNCVLPDVRKRLFPRTLLACLKRGVSFLCDGSTGIVNLQNLTEISHCSGVTRDDLKRFQNLQKLELFREFDIDFDGKTYPIHETLEELTAFDLTLNKQLAPFKRLTKLQMIRCDLDMKFLTPSHALCDSVTNLMISSSYIPDNKLQNFRNIHTLDISGTEATMGFVTASHWLSGTLVNLIAVKSNITDGALSAMVNLVHLNLNGTNVTLDFLTQQHPLWSTLTELEINGTRVQNSALQHLQKLKNLYMINTQISLEYDSSPMYHTLEYLAATSSKISDVALCRFVNLTHLQCYVNPKATLAFLRDGPHLSQHPLTRTLKYVDSDIYVPLDINM